MWLVPGLVLGDSRKKGKFASFVLHIRDCGRNQLGWVAVRKSLLNLDHLQCYVEEHCIAMFAPTSDLGDWEFRPHPYRVALFD